MDDTIRNDRALYLECKGAAIDIFTEMESAHSGYPDEWSPAEDRDEMQDKAHEWADSSQHVIYNYRAIQICANCDTSHGEQWIEDVGMPETPTFESLAVSIAFGEMRGRIGEELDTLCDEWENPFTPYLIGAHFLPALINSDIEGLSAKDESDLAAFIDRETTPQGHWATCDENGGMEFARCEVTGLHSDCARVVWVDMETVAANRDLLTLDSDPSPTPRSAAYGALAAARAAMVEAGVPDYLTRVLDALRGFLDAMPKEDSTDAE